MSEQEQTNIYRIQIMEEDLPIAKYRKKITNTIASNKVVIISGKTGCGKSTQVPQYILNSETSIAVCQPRRIAAKSLAVRVAQEMRQPLGKIVGYQIGMDSTISDKTRLTYMTYGILVQQLLFNEVPKYTHIVLDQVHQQSIEMSFMFVVLKKILNQRQSKIKLVIMSATLKSQEFSRYFASNQETGQLQLAEITITQTAENPQSRRRQRYQMDEKNHTVKITNSQSNYTQAPAIILPDENKFKIDVVYLTSDAPNYKEDYEATIPEKLYSKAATLIAKNQHLGDILVFLPGIAEIKRMKKEVRSIQIGVQQIIEVHSAFSDGLYQKLFDNNVHSKIILATNMGESSITLPNCNVVIDFCLNRKNYTNKEMGFTKLQTRVASKTNLLQRAGRVGRISDGVVFRMISQPQYEKMKEFDIPEIQCVSLEMVILKIKQMDALYSCDSFADPYTVLFNVLQPPALVDIQKSISELVFEQALSYEDNGKLPPQGLRYDGKKLALTNIGQFIVSMPCDIRISKMLLLGLKLKVAKAITDIAAISISNKAFFTHEERRVNIQQFMHTIVDYDRGRHNDYLLQQAIFDDWRSTFFQVNKPSKFVSKQQLETFVNETSCFNEELFQDSYFNSKQFSSLKNFCQRNPGKEEIMWCQGRSLYARRLRQILKMADNLRARLKSIGFKNDFNKKAEDSNLILMCLVAAFKNTQCSVTFQKAGFQAAKQQGLSKQQKKSKNGKYRPKQELRFKVELEEQVSPQRLKNFLFPNTDYELIKRDNAKMMVRGSPSVVSKLLMPKYFKKSNLEPTSKLFQSLCNRPPLEIFHSQIRRDYYKICILSDSVNMTILPVFSTGNYYLISNNLIQSKRSLLISASALVTAQNFLLISMMMRENIEFYLHISKEFFNRVTINGEMHELDFLLENTDLDVIRATRANSKHKMHNNIASTQQYVSEQLKNQIVKLLGSQLPTISSQRWQEIFITQNYSYEEAKSCMINYSICELPKLKEPRTFFSKYNQWKENIYYNLYKTYRTCTIKNIIVVCSLCYPKEIMQVESPENYHDNTLRLNEYTGSWMIDDSKLKCRNGHLIGEVVDPEYAKVHSVGFYVPFQRYFPISEADCLPNPEITQVEAKAAKIKQLTCYICSCYQRSSRETKMNVMEERKGSQEFWKEIKKHMNSYNHIKNVQQFCQSFK